MREFIMYFWPLGLQTRQLAREVYYKSVKYEVDVAESQKYHSLKVTRELQALPSTPETNSERL